MANFRIGDRVMVKWYEDIPHEFRGCDTENPAIFNKAKAKLCGCCGTVTDIVYSNAFDCDYYVIKFDDFDKTSIARLIDEHLVAEQTAYSVNILFENGWAKAFLYDQKDELVTSSSARIFEYTAVGYAQSASYAMKLVYENLNDGKLRLGR